MACRIEIVKKKRFVWQLYASWECKAIAQISNSFALNSRRKTKCIKAVNGKWAKPKSLNRKRRALSINERRKIHKIRMVASPPSFTTVDYAKLLSIFYTFWSAFSHCVFCLLHSHITFLFAIKVISSLFARERFFCFSSRFARLWWVNDMFCAIFAESILYLETATRDICASSFQWSSYSSLHFLHKNKTLDSVLPCNCTHLLWWWVN